MSSFKKLRLDPELPPAHRNQPGANDSGNRPFMDGSSFSSSTSGGSGAYGRSTGPFRTRYSQPFGAPSPNTNSFSRFAPYYFGKERRTSLRVPLIRARRDDSDSEGNRPSSRASLNSSLGGDSTASATSSTAQRIIETLQNLSTPVMNAGKIRIDQDIKAVQPMHFGSSLSRMSPGGSLNRSTGPPKMCSSLLMSNPSPANQTSPMFNPGDQRRLFCIPRMIDAATNTDKEEAPSPSQMHVSVKSVAPSTTPQFSSGTNIKSVTPILPKDDNSEEEFHECSSEFTFSNPWAPDVFDRYLANQDKSTGKGVQQPLLNGFKETPTSFGVSQSPTSSSSFSAPSGINPSFSSTVTTKTSTAAPAFSGFSGSTGGSSFGSSSLKGSPVGKSPLNSSSDIKSDASKLFGIGGVGGTSSASEINKPVSSSLAGFFSSSAASPLKASEPSKLATFDNLTGKSVQSTTASSSVDKVDAPKTDSPVAAKFSFGTNSSSTTSTLPPLTSLVKNSAIWRCPTCMVENDVKVAACVCCGEKNTTSVAASKPATTNVVKKKWRCPTCMVENEVEAASCVCCSEKNPNPVQGLIPLSSTVVASKKWRCPTCMVENDPTVASCVCCSEKNPNPVISENKDSSTAAGTAPAPKFSFGVSNTAATSATSSAATSNNSFVFGAPAQSDINKKAPIPEFKFGMSSTTTSTPSSVSSSLAWTTFSQSTSTAGSSTFKFGSSSSTSTASPSPGPTFGFIGSTSTASQVTSTVTSTPTTTSSSIFSAPKGPESNSSSTASGPFGAPNFQTSQSTHSSSFKFGAVPPATSDAQKQSTPSFSFGASSSTKPAFGNFSFGDRQQNQSGALPGATSTILTPAAQAPAPTPPLGGTPANFNFGSSNPTASPFGQLQSNPSNPTQSSAGGLFQFGKGSSNPPAPSLTPAPSFSLTPNLNFGATPGSTIPFGNPTQPTPNAGSQPPPSLFQFSSTPSDSPGGRKIKKAVRRFKQ